MIKRSLIFGLILLSIELLNAQGLSFNGYVSGIYSPILTLNPNKEDISHNGLLHNRLNFKYSISNWKFISDIRNRILFGDYSLYYKNNFILLTKDNGLMNLSWNINSGNYYLLNSSIERLSINYETDKLSLRIGRQRINWSEALVFNPNDIFNTYSFFDFDYPERKGSDAIRFSYYPNETSTIEIAAKLDNTNRPTIAGLARTNTLGWDIQAITGILNNEDYFLGFGFSGDIKGINLRGEFNYYIPYNDLIYKDNSIITCLGADYIFKNSISLSSEILYNQQRQGVSNNFYQMLYLSLSPRQLSISDWTLVSQISYPFNPLLSASLSAMSFINLPAFYFGTSIEYSIKENLSLSSMLQVFIGERYNSNNIILGYIRLKYSF
ncbi:MAG: hypothetical protein H6Q15_565 [Bacteroidetes bacterium]|nr:hypothetical protein [Bacteroidota bacterium]